MKRDLVYFGNPLLRSRCEDVKEITPKIKQLCFDMIETMDANNGIGLAAIQVGILLRIIVIRPVIEDEEKKAILGDPEIYINPKISNPSNEKDFLSEGCLSVPGIHAEVQRPVSVQLKALDLDGNVIEKNLVGFKAREIMHENDHLNGVLFIDRLSSKLKKEIEPELRKIKSKYNF